MGESRDSSVGITTGYGLDGQDSIPGRGKIFRLPIASRPVLGPAHLLIQWAPGALSLRVKRPGCEVNY
jgi:hypothetical protein